MCVVEKLDLSFNPYFDGNKGFNDVVYTSKIKTDGKIVAGGEFYVYNDEFWWSCF